MREEEKEKKRNELLAVELSELSGAMQFFFKLLKTI